MANRDAYQQRADKLLRQATATSDLGERSRLISEAVKWHMMAAAPESTSAADDGEDAQPEDPGTPEPDTA